VSDRRNYEMDEEHGVLAEIVSTVADRCSVESIPVVLARLTRIREWLQARSPDLGMVSPRESSRPSQIMDAVRMMADLIRDPVRVEEIRQEDVAATLTVMAALEAALAARLMVEKPKAVDAPEREDRLLTTDEAAALLRVTPQWLYRRTDRLPFARRLSRKALRFSEAGIRRWMATKSREVRKAG
jgi:predicted DNA-binding transcriptional regulator AlpA